MVSLYCGLLFLAFYFFYYERDKNKGKSVGALAVGFMFTSCWLIPLDCIWSGMRYAGTTVFDIASL